MKNKKLKWVINSSAKLKNPPIYYTDYVLLSDGMEKFAFVVNDQEAITIQHPFDKLDLILNTNDLKTLMIEVQALVNNNFI